MSRLLDTAMGPRSGVPLAEPPAVVTASPSPVESWYGTRLRGTLYFLAVPGSVVVASAVFGVQLPTVALYLIAGGVGAAAAVRALRDPEWLLALTIIYLPLNKIYVASLAPGVNGTNALILLLLAAWAAQIAGRGERLFRPLPLGKPVAVFALLGALSGITAAVRFGFDFLAENALLYKGWLDQFIVFAAVLNLIRDGAMARRLVIYGAIGLFATMALGTLEWLDKAGEATIEKQRVFGPQMQPNDFGAFLVYAAGPLVGLALVYLQRPLTWLAGPPLAGVLIKLLLVTYSRGAYLGMAVGAVSALWTRGRMLTVAGFASAGLIALVFPQVLPDAIRDRLAPVQTAPGAASHLDQSASTRLILWNAALRMTGESPLLGKGFGAFPRLKDQYTEIPVRESDTHSFYLYTSAQMGLPALAALLWILVSAQLAGVELGRHARESFARAFGIGMCCTVSGAAVVNLFGSRLGDLAVSLPFWLVLAIGAHLLHEHRQK